jgi:hypothetical protein
MPTPPWRGGLCTCFGSSKMDKLWNRCGSMGSEAHHRPTQIAPKCSCCFSICPECECSAILRALFILSTDSFHSLDKIISFIHSTELIPPFQGDPTKSAISAQHYLPFHHRCGYHTSTAGLISSFHNGTDSSSSPYSTPGVGWGEGI